MLFRCFLVISLKYMVIELTSDITKTSELFVLFRYLNNTNGMVVNDLGERRTHFDSIWSRLKEKEA